MDDIKSEVRSKTPQLDRIIAEGTSGAGYKRQGKPNNLIRCADGFQLSVIAGPGNYCSPRPDGFRDSDPDDSYEGPYDQVEVGYPSERPEPWDQWSEWCESPGFPTESVYGYVPVDAVRALVLLHGGEAS
jgi:hypothetical protein